MLERFKRHGIHIVLVLAVFVLFCANAIGVFELAVDIDGGSLSFPAVTRSNEFLLLIAIGILLSVALPMLNPVWASVITLLSMLPVIYLEYMPNPVRSLIPMEYSLLTALMLFVVHVLISFFTETHKKQKIVEAFAQYVPPEVAAQIGRDPSKFQLEGESRELCVMFCDIHNFTGISEKLGPKQLAQLLEHAVYPR